MHLTLARFFVSRGEGPRHVIRLEDEFSRFSGDKSEAVRDLAGF